MSSERSYVGIGFSPAAKPTLVVAIAREDLRHWAIIEVVTEWRGPVHIIEDASDLFRSRYNPGFVLLICPENFGQVLRRYPRRWRHLNTNAYVFLVESLANLERIEQYVQTVHSVLVEGLHEGKAQMIIAAARAGMLALPPAILERQLQSRVRHGSPRLDDRGGA